MLPIRLSPCSTLRAWRALDVVCNPSVLNGREFVHTSSAMPPPNLATRLPPPSKHQVIRRELSVTGRPCASRAAFRRMSSLTLSIPRRMRPPATRHLADGDAPPDGPLGFGRVAQRGSACTSPTDCTPPRPLEKYFL